MSERKMTMYKTVCSDCGTDIEVTEPIDMPMFFEADLIGGGYHLMRPRCSECRGEFVNLNLNVLKSVDDGDRLSTNHLLEKYAKERSDLAGVACCKAMERKMSNAIGKKVTIKNKETFSEWVVNAYINRLIHGTIPAPDIEIEIEGEENER